MNYAISWNKGRDTFGAITLLQCCIILLFFQDTAQIPSLRLSQDPFEVPVATHFPCRFRRSLPFTPATFMSDTSLCDISATINVVPPPVTSFHHHSQQLSAETTFSAASWLAHPFSPNPSLPRALYLATTGDVIPASASPLLFPSADSRALPGEAEVQGTSSNLIDCTQCSYVAFFASARASIDLAIFSSNSCAGCAEACWSSW